jgi:peptidoglycan/LPS O-acetylase OafA/YrhL
MNRLLALDSLRGLAALSVVLYHYTFVYRKDFGHRFSSFFDFKYGYLGVELFFVISGFVIFLTINNISNWQDFVFKRFSRLYPTYWASMIFTFLCIVSFGLKGVNINAIEFISNFSMIQGLFDIDNVDGVYWSLIPELLFYMMMLGLYISGLKDKVLYLGLIWISLSFIHLNIYHIKIVGGLFNLSYTYFFYSGILFYLLKYDKDNRNLVILQLIICFVLSTLTFKVKGGVTEQLILAGIFLVFYLFTNDKLEFVINKPFLFLGNISYSLYLVHENVGFIIMNKTKSFFGQSILILIPPLLVSMICAYLITKYIEKPSIRILKDLYVKKSLNRKLNIILDSKLELSDK